LRGGDVRGLAGLEVHATASGRHCKNKQARQKSRKDSKTSLHGVPLQL
jgi:hypothetical protein